MLDVGGEFLEFLGAHHEGTVISWDDIYLGDELLRQAADAKSGVLSIVVIAVVGRVDEATVEVQVVRAVATARRLRPVVAAATSIVDRRAADVAGVEEIIWIFPNISRSTTEISIKRCKFFR